MADSNILKQIVRIENDKKAIAEKVNTFLKKNDAGTLTALVATDANLDTLKDTINQIPNRGHVSETLGYQGSYIVPLGYHDGTGTVSNNIGAGTVKSGIATVTTNSFSYQSTGTNAGKFEITNTVNVTAPSVTTDGYVSTSIGTKTANNSLTSKTVVNKITGSTAFSGTATVTPAIKRTAKPTTDTWTDAASGTVTTAKPTSGVYVRVDADAKTTSITATPSVTTAGYGTATNHGIEGNTLSVGANAATTTYIPITTSTGADKTTLDCGEVATIKAGYLVSDVYVTANDLSAQTPATIKSGAAKTGAAPTYAYNSTNKNFDVTNTINVDAPTVTTAGYISSTVGTRNAYNTLKPTTTVDEIKGSTTLEGATSAKLPTIARLEFTINGVTDAASGAAVVVSGSTTAPTSGVYVKVKSAANTATITATPEVTTAGYGTTANHGIAGNSATVGAAASADTYIPIKTSTKPSVLTINAGGKVTIPVGYVTTAYDVTANSLGSQTSGTAVAADIRNNKTAWVNGSKVTGSMPDATLSNAKTGNLTDADYSTIDNSNVIIPSNGYLYITKGYTGNVKIALSKLIPDEANIVASTGADYILSGTSAYDKDGKLIVGQITDNGVANITIDGLVSATDNGIPTGASLSGFYASGSSVNLTNSIYNRLAAI